MPKFRLNVRLVGYALALILAIGLMLYLRRQDRGSDRSASGLEVVRRDYPEVRQEGVLRLLAAYGEGGEVQGGRLTGSIYELAQQLQSRSGLRVEVILENRWDEALKKLASGAADLVARPLTHTSEVDTTLFMLFAEQTSGPIYLVQRRADSTHHISRQVELAGRSITLPEASPLRLFLEHLGEEIGDSLHVQIDTVYAAEQLAMQVAAGSISYTVCTSPEAKRFTRIFPELDCTLPLSYSVRTAWLMRRSSQALRDSLLVWGAVR